MNNPARSRKHWLVLAIACCMSSASIGIILNTVGLFYVPVAEDLNILVGSFSFHATIVSLAIAVFSLFFPSLKERFGWKPTLTAGVITAFIGTAGMGLTNNLTVFYILGAFRGAGAALFGIVPMTILVNNWFEEKNGLALSIANAFAGIIGALFSPIITALINGQGWEMAFFWKGVLIVLFCLPAIFYSYSFRPEDDGYVPYGLDTFERSSGENLYATQTKHFSYVGIPFITIMIFAVLHAIVMGVTTHIPGIGESAGLTTQTAGIMVSSLMIGNIIAKLSMGQLSDTIGVVKSTTIMITINILAITVLIASSESAGMLILGAGLYGSVYAVSGVTFPVLSKEYFGRTVANRIFPIISFALNIGQAIAISAVGFIFDFTGSYMISLVSVLIFNVLNIGLMFWGVKIQKVKI